MSIKLKVKKKRKTVWSIIPNLKKLKVLYKPTVTMNELTDTLYNTKPYYLNDMGLSVYPNGSDVEKKEALYMWGLLKDWSTPDGEQLYVWEKKCPHDGKFKNIRYGTRKDFDKVVAQRINNEDKITK